LQRDRSLDGPRKRLSDVAQIARNIVVTGTADDQVLIPASEQYVIRGATDDPILTRAAR